MRHVGPTLGFRVEWNGASVAYVPDHGPGCCPDDPDDYVPHDVLELCDGVDLLIHDAQHTPRGVRAEAALGPLHRRLRACTSRAKPARSSSCCSTTTRRTATTTLDASRAHAPTARPRIGGPEVIAAYDGLELDLAAHRSERPRQR